MNCGEGECLKIQNFDIKGQTIGIRLNRSVEERMEKDATREGCADFHRMLYISTMQAEEIGEIEVTRFL